MKRILKILLAGIILLVALVFSLWLFRAVDDIDLPFVEDPEVIGVWESVDFVANPSDFQPGSRASRVDLYLKQLEFLPKGRLGVPYRRWTKGTITHLGDNTASSYTIRTFSDKPYLFFQWKSGDYVYLHKKPKYYVLRKK